MTSANEIWVQLSDPWQEAFTEAWASYSEGSLGIGAVLADPTTGTVVSAGRNRVNSTLPLPRTLSGNFMAHAEMNAFAALDRFKADELAIYTTLQPCLMCAATAVFMHVESSVQAAANPGGPVIQQAEQDIPDIAALARSAEVNSALAEIAKGRGNVEEAVGAVLPYLEWPLGS